MKVIIDRLDDFGRGIAVINNKITFVNDVYPGDEVIIEIIEEKKKYNVANVIEYIKRGSYFLDNGCPNKCGGCSLITSYAKEKEYKENLVKKFFPNVLIKEFVQLERENYRNKITLHYDKVLGLYEEKTNKVVDINVCLLVTKRINEIISKLKNIIIKNKGALTIIIKYINEILIDIKGEFNIDYDDILKLCDVLYINDKCLTTKKYLEKDGLFIGPNSFYQINDKVCKLLYDEILLNVNKNDKVLDLYSGVGSISKHISNSVNMVVGIEIIEEAVILANKMNLSNAYFKYGDVVKYLKEFKDYNKVIVDPPRSGLNKKVVEELNNNKYDSIIYVSCNIRTLKRDIDLLTNYKIKYVRGFNMFPYTFHCESITILERRYKMKILIICSKKFYSKIEEVKKNLEKKNIEVFLPNCYDDPTAEQKAWDLGTEEHQKFKAAMYKQSEDTISNMDAVLVLNLDKEKKGEMLKNYIGGATFLEMYDAFRLGKKIYLYNNIPNGMLYDEIEGFSPIIIDGNLELIK